MFTRFLLVLGVVAAIFAGYSLAVFLSRAASGLLKPAFVATLVAMKTIIAIEVLAPIALFVAVLFGIEHLRRHEETTALQAVGFGPRQAAVALFPLFLFVAALVGILSFWVRPLTYAELYDTRHRARLAFDVLDVEPGRIYTDDDGKRVIKVDERTPDGVLRGVFIWTHRDDYEVIVKADALTPKTEDDPRAGAVEAENLRVWKFEDGKISPWIRSSSLVTDFDLIGLSEPGFKRKAASSMTLLESDDPEDQAEFQWRATRSLSALVLGFMALLISGWNRSRSRMSVQVVLAVTACIGYYAISLTARNWMRQGMVGPNPGLWWVDAALAFILFLLFVPRRRFGTGRRRGGKVGIEG